MGRFFDAMLRLEALEAGWHKVRGNSGGPGGDGVTVEAFARGLAGRLTHLQRALAAGTYQPGPLRAVGIPKDDGDLRWLAIPCVADRVAQTAAANALMPRLDGEMEESSFAYRPGRSVQDAVRQVAEHRRQGYTWVVDGDIERYFDSVPHDLLLARLEPLLEDRPMLDLIGLWLEGFSEHGRGLPQGSPLSPLLANLYLDAVDEAIARRGVRLVRFADDFVLLCKSEARAEAAQRRMADLLAEHGLRLHPEKTRIVPFAQGFRFLGHLFVRSVVLKALEDDEDEALAAAAEALRRPALPPWQAPEEADDPLPPSAEPAPRFRVLYVTEKGRLLDRRNDAFIVRDRASVLDEDRDDRDAPEVLALPWRSVDRIELHPGTAATEAALRHAMATGREVAYVDGRGAMLGSVRGPGDARSERHLAQARHALDPALRRDLAARIVDGRLRNQRALLRRLNRRRKNADVAARLVQLNRTIRKLPVAADVPSLMGLEGAGAALYWPALGRMLEHGWRFARRRRQPPPDPVNLAISFLSSLLYRDLGTLVQRHGLHPGFGALHAARDGAPACLSDLVEEFRAPLAEGLAVYLFNNRVLDRGMFSRRDGACHVDREGLQALIRGYEAWLDRPVKSPRGGTRVAWRGLMEEQVLAYARHVEDREPYRPYLMDY